MSVIVCDLFQSHEFIQRQFACSFVFGSTVYILLSLIKRHLYWNILLYKRSSFRFTYLVYIEKTTKIKSQRNFLHYTWDPQTNFTSKTKTPRILKRKGCKKDQSSTMTKRLGYGETHRSKV